MIAAELRGGSKPSLNEALAWIGSRVDDIYGASVGRLDDVWIDPGTGTPRWLLVMEGRFGGRATLIPFEDATAGAGHVWVPYERDVVRAAPEVEAGGPLTQELETALRAHYSASAPRSASRPPAPAPARSERDAGTTIRFGGLAEDSTDGPARVGESAPGSAAAVPHAAAAPLMPERPAPPVEAPPRRETPSASPPEFAPPRSPDRAVPRRVGEEELVYRHPGPERHAPMPEPRTEPQPRQPDPYRYAPEPAADRDPAQAHVDALRDLATAGGTHFVEIELSGELSIRGELRSIRVTPHERRPSDR